MRFEASSPRGALLKRCASTYHERLAAGTRPSSSTALHSLAKPPAKRGGTARPRRRRCPTRATSSRPNRRRRGQGSAQIFRWRPSYPRRRGITRKKLQGRQSAVFYLLAFSCVLLCWCWRVGRRPWLQYAFYYMFWRFAFWVWDVWDIKSPFFRKFLIRVREKLVKKQ